MVFSKTSLFACAGALVASGLAGAATATPLAARDTTVSVETCDCGFIDYYDPNQSTFASYYRTDFTSNSVTNDNISDSFRLSSSVVSKSTSPYSRSFSPEQVSVSSEGLALTVSPNTSDGSVPSAAIYTNEEYFGFGSYHLVAQVSNLTGSVAAFYVYKNDTSEVDMEYVSKPANSSHVQFLQDSVKPQIYQSNGAASNLTYEKQWPKLKGSASFSDKPHHWAFSWLPESVTFGLNNNYSVQLTTNVPQADGFLVLSHWSDGNPYYSQGPPSANSTFLVDQFWAVHNSTTVSSQTELPAGEINGKNSTSSAMACKKMSTPCYVYNPSGTDNGLYTAKPTSTTSASSTSTAAAASSTSAAATGSSTFKTPASESTSGAVGVPSPKAAILLGMALAALAALTAA